MEGGTKDYSVRGVREVFLRNIFLLSTYLGLFPFVFTETEIKITRWLLPSCVVHLTKGIFHMTQYRRLLQVYSTFNKISKFLNIWIIVGALLWMVPVLSIVNISLNIKKFSKMLHALTVVENITKKLIVDLNIWFPIISFLSFTLIWLYECYYVQMWVSLQQNFSSLFTICIVLSQFTTLTSVISGHYTVLLATLCQENAVVLTQCPWRLYQYSYELLLSAIVVRNWYFFLLISSLIRSF